MNNKLLALIIFSLTSSMIQAQTYRSPNAPFNYSECLDNARTASSTSGGLFDAAACRAQANAQPLTIVTPAPTSQNSNPYYNSTDEQRSKALQARSQILQQQQIMQNQAMQNAINAQQQAEARRIKKELDSVPSDDWMLDQFVSKTGRQVVTYIRSDKSKRIARLKLLCIKPKNEQVKLMQLEFDPIFANTNFSTGKIIVSGDDGLQKTFNLTNFGNLGSGGISLYLDENNNLKAQKQEDLDLFKIMLQNRKFSISYLNPSNQDIKTTFDTSNFGVGLKNAAQNCNLE